jgi:CRISPR-associated endonuclease/helicase Cas3
MTTLTSPIEYENTNDIADKAEAIKVTSGNVFWGEFDLKNEITQLAKNLHLSEEMALVKFTHLSLRKLDENSDEHWQCHPMLGVYKILKKDEYNND